MDKNSQRFEECFKKYANLIVKIVMNKTSDYQLAQEIMQQVFCEFYIHMDYINPEAEKAWLMRSTRNAVIDQQRKGQKHREIFADFTEPESEQELCCCMKVEESQSWEDRLDMRELAGRILKEIKMENRQWYDALILCFVDELTYEEAAKILGISKDLLRMRVCRARAFIRKKFIDELHGE